MKNTISIFIIFFAIITAVSGQGKKSKGDDYFFQYSYKKAIIAYEDDMLKGIVLSPVQYLNLADSYFQVQNFEKANDMYLQYFSNDTITDNYRLNRLLLGLSKISDNNRIKEVLRDKGLGFQKELIENSDFNYNILSNKKVEGNLDFNVFNLISNSAQSDFSPSFYEDDLLFTSGRPLGKKANYEPTNESYLDIFKGKINTDGQLENPIVLSSLENSNYHKATPYFSEKLNSVFYVLSNTNDGELEFDENGKNSLAIGVQKLNGQFRFLWRDLSTSFYYPFYDANTDRLYFAANLDNGYGGTDIYYVNTNNGNVMSAPINLGPRINSPGNEIAPYIFENSLYFSSDVFYGLGGMDIYKASISGDEFGIPLNLGPTINSAEDDFGFVIKNKGDGLLGYFSSNRPGGKGGDDIYGFMVDEKPGIKTLVLKGKVLRQGKKTGLANANVKLKTKSGDLLHSAITSEDGAYRIEIPWQDEIVFEVSKEKHSVYSQNYTSTALEELQDIDANIGLVAYQDIVEEKEGQTVIKLKKFYFQKNRTSITEAIATELDKVVEAVSLFPEIQLRIETHTDSRGGGATNFRLTQQRSDAIKKYLISKGVSNANILYSVGYGEDKIINNCKNGVYCIELLHQQNQRCLLVVLNDNILFN
ncbi:OmpA family protein [Croceitalea rosinachiae]|uniref:OmpA family protein n=1 Tax=Croceitalea rosinachiae TaxID=3075596 RepID=A0ABU3A632_9FLAO|nr:OmpA family protein [Croceitalea sp. F388]MDT0605634.1 OmpA family protein [Croceitalea sp. F388]